LGKIQFQNAKKIVFMMFSWEMEWRLGLWHQLAKVYHSQQVE
jgi:hypothetical protein